MVALAPPGGRRGRASSLRISAGSAQRAPNVADGKLLVPTFDGEVDVYQLN